MQLLQQNPGETLPGGHVEAIVGLVQQGQRGAGRQRQAEESSRALPAAESHGVAALGNVEPGQQLDGAFHVEVRMHPGDVAREVTQALISSEGPVLRRQVDRPGCGLGQLPAENLRLTGVPGLTAGQQPQQRGLAGPVPSDQAGHRADGCRQVHLLQHHP